MHYSPYGRYLGWGMLVLLATGLLLGGWNMVLRRVVTSKTAALAKALKDLKTANDTTREVNDQLTATLEAIPDMLLRVDQKGCLLEVFASKEDGVRTLPYGELGKSFSELLPAEAAQTLADAIDVAASSGSDYGRVLALTIAGQPRWFELSTALKRSSEGKPPQFLMLSRDITMRRQSELELIRMKEAALEAEKNKQFRLLFDSAPVAMVYLHGQVIESVNRCFTALFGYEEGDISTLQDWWLRAYPDTSYRASVQTQWAQAVEQAMLAQGMVQAQEYQVSCKDGQRLTMLIGGQMVDNGMIVTLTDISQLKQVQRQLDLARTAAQAANAAKSAFLANMSHEIRTPMNAIVGMAHQMRRVGLPTHQGERLDKIDTAAQHLLMVISDILDISKIESGKLVLEQTPVDLVALLDNVKTISMARASSKGLSLGIETDTLPDKLLGDLTRLQQCLLNYVGNAIKFTDHGSITLKVHVVEETTQTVLLRFEVTDTGPGIPADVLSRLFGAFVQADNSITRRYGGTGLGLSINRLLAELMGGEADAISTPGTGSTFWFTARLTKSSEPVVMLPQAPLVDADAIIRREYSGSRILVVDDEPTNQAVLEFLLQDAGLHVDLADDGFQAVAKARASTYAAIFMDMQMPGLDGLDATRQIRALPTHTRTPILAMTGNAFEEDRLSCLAAGMNDFLTKPVMPKQLFAALLKALEQDTV
ncbi:response regulator [Rhodoferax fermentans]|uniref:Virulence sensor protein BvgS n=1 Tax=Rhodoferax fermentans TaxID=28066 RepID=A0A1T1AVJ1_RHOFE|nr:response regulator [Rhodoferax fermentans]MBK1682003.1 hypothetical protein [Rhodoferax fermentans]OOV07995.1 hypothetical protein RF819_15840 [Rhodoferax fermentans]